jgi:tetratricopeptide (TPR) repeat protein
MVVRSEIEHLVGQGISAAKAGRQDEARELLSAVLELDPENELAWLWMSAVVSDDDKIVCLENVLTINPANELARLGLESLLEKSTAVEEPEEEAEAAEPEESPGEGAEEAGLEESSATGEEVSERGGNCLKYAALAFLAVMAVSVCGLAVVLGGMLLPRDIQQAAPAVTTVASIPGQSYIPTPEVTSTSSCTPTATRTPVPTNTLVVPDARIPGFPIVSEGAYDEVELRVRDLRELESLRQVETVTFTRYRLEDYLTEVYHREEFLAEMEAAERLYRVLGLIDEEYDLVDSEIEVLREDVAGLYDSEKEEIYLILDRYTSDLWLEVTYAHEFTHALQDQHFDLEALYGQSTTTDSALALQTLIEGDATLVMVEYAYRYLFEMSFERSELLEAIQGVEQGEYQDAPTVVRETAWFPYDQGIVFVAALAERGGWEQVNQAFRSPPETTEQVMHPDKYLAGEVGHPPEMASLADVLGPGWVELVRDVLGELYIRVYLERALGSEDALMAAEGWEGDRGVLLVNEDEDRYVWVHRMSWDSVDNADEFASFYVTFMARAGTSPAVLDEEYRKRWQAEDQVTYLGQSGQETLLVLASDPETMDLLLPAFSGF